jgi:hypothetical protein
LGISAGEGISAKTISSKLRIFAGVCRWRIPTGIDIQIRVEKVIEGQICYGELVLIQPKEEKMPEISCAGKVIEIDGKKYKLMEA